MKSSLAEDETAENRAENPATLQCFARRARLFGLLVHRPRWTLTWRGRLLAAGIVLGAAVTAFYGTFPFLALTKRVPSEVLVVDGFDTDYALKAAWEEFASQHYQYLLTTGGLVQSGVDIEPDDTYARMAANTLKHLGARPEVVIAVPAAPVRRDRTYASATAVKNWLALSRPRDKAINIVSIGPHARRSRLIYEKALGPEYAIGVIAIEDREYDPKHWWRFSQGVKEVISEAAAYVYARFLFYP